MVNQFTVDYMDDMYYNMRYTYGSSTGEDDDYDYLATLYIGLVDARKRGVKDIVAGAVRNYDKTVESDCLIRPSYGCLYSLVKEDENAAN